MVARKTIDYIKFQIMSPEMIRKMSAVEVKVPETYDEDGFPIENGLMDPRMGVVDPGLRCKTCGQKMNKCPGHFGHIELVRPVIHTEYVRYIEAFLNATCKKCGRIVLPDEEIQKIVKKYPPKERLKIFAKKGAKVTKCPHCGVERKKIVFDRPYNFYEGDKRLWPTEIRERFEKIPNKDLEAMGFDPKIFRPEWLILTVLPVPPVTVRPSIVLETGERAEDDLTHKLAEIVRVNQRLKENIEAGVPQLIIEDLWNLLQYHVSTYFNNETPGCPPAKHRSGRPLKTLIQRLKGKEGRFRYNLSGKRVNFAGRAVITPDPLLSINQIGVPRMMAELITIPMHVTEWNLEKARELVLRKEYPRALYVIRPDGTRKRVTDTNREDLAKELAPGYIVERQVMDGDVVLFNRQPSLHRISLMAFNVVVLPGKTLRIQPITCIPFNADFDGDEMNVHFLQTKEAQTEAREIILAENHIISPRYGAPIIVPEEDYITAAFLLTSLKFTKEQAMQLLYAAGITDLPEPDEDGLISGKKIFSKLLPKDFTISFKSATCKLLSKLPECDRDCKNCPLDAFVIIENGELKSGVIDAAALGEGKGIIIDALVRRYGKEVAREFLDRFSRMAVQLFRIVGFTTFFHELKIPKEVEEEIQKILDEGEEKAKEYIELYKKGKLEPLPGKTLEESLEAYIIQALNEAVSKVTEIIFQEKYKIFKKNKLALPILAMIITGARGKLTNIVNMVGTHGQAFVREKRPHRGFQGRVISHFKPGDISPRARGFVRSPLAKGLSMEEMFFWGMGGRMGEVDKGVSTQISGYYYRRLSNALMDLIAFPDGTVREATRDVIVQFTYADDGIFPTNALRGRVPLESVWARVKK